MAPSEFLMIESDLRERVSRRVHAVSQHEAAALAAEINSLIERRNAMTGRRAA